MQEQSVAEQAGDEDKVKCLRNRLERLDEALLTLLRAQILGQLCRLQHFPAVLHHGLLLTQLQQGHAVSVQRS